MTQDLWKLTRTESRKNAVRLLSELLNEPVFSKLMDRSLELAIDRLRRKDEVRRELIAQVKIMKSKMNSFNLLPEDIGLEGRAK